VVVVKNMILHLFRKHVIDIDLFPGRNGDEVEFANIQGYEDVDITILENQLAVYS
jgi:hypothetical protein